VNFLIEFKNQLKALAATSAKSYSDTAIIKSGGKIFFRNRDLFDFSSFDVLALSEQKSVRRAVQESLEVSGFGSASSRKNVGTRAEHLVCEKALAKFFGLPQALLFSSRNQAIYSLLATLLTEHDQLICDEDMQGVLSDVCLLQNCNLEVVDLTKVAKLENALQQPFYGRHRFVFVDSVAQGSARSVDLAAISACCQRQSAFFLLDESYAAGILGARGSGVFEQLSSTPSLIPNSLTPKPFALIVDLGLGLASSAACICADTDVVRAIIANSRTLSHEASLPACLAAGIKAALDACELSFAPRALLQAKREFILSSLLKIKQSLKIEGSSSVCIKFNKLSEAFALQEHLFNKGFWLDVCPTTSKASQAAFVKMNPSVKHSEEVVLDLLEAFNEYFNPIDH
jgi:8-amino-7-oxononanoate synthase